MTGAPPSQSLDPTIAVVVILLLLLYFALHLFVEYRLRRDHEDAWKRLKEPHLLGPGAIWALLAVMFFMLTTRHKALSDPALTLAVYGLRTTFLLCAAFRLWCI